MFLVQQPPLRSPICTALRAPLAWRCDFAPHTQMCVVYRISTSPNRGRYLGALLQGGGNTSKPPGARGVKGGGGGEPNGRRAGARAGGGKRRSGKQFTFFSQRTCYQLPNGCFGARKSIGPGLGAKLGAGVNRTGEPIACR
jgi:hypothetical protein